MTHHVHRHGITTDRGGVVLTLEVSALITPRVAIENNWNSSIPGWRFMHFRLARIHFKSCRFREIPWQSENDGNSCIPGRRLMQFRLASIHFISCRFREALWQWENDGNPCISGWRGFALNHVVPETPHGNRKNDGNSCISGWRGLPRVGEGLPRLGEPPRALARV